MLTGEFITDIFVWHANAANLAAQVVAIQFVKNTYHLSPIYGIQAGSTSPPVLLSGDGHALVGISGNYHASALLQIQVSDLCYLDCDM
jgi:hypothetical protein